MCYNRSMTNAINPSVPNKPTDEERQAAALAARKEIAENVLLRTDEFDYDFLELYMSDPFLGGVSLDITKVADQACQTAYVGVRKNGARHEVILGFSPKFMRGMSKEERKGVICHELYHVIFSHIFHRSVAKTTDQMMWNWACFPAGTILADGSKIENPGSSTLGQSGKVSVVSPMSRPYSGKMYKIRAGGMTYTATDEHPFRTVSRKNSACPIKLTAETWTEAKNVTKNDYLIIPKLPGSFTDESIDLTSFISSGTDSIGRKTFGNRVPNRTFPINADTAWLLGLYTSEGSGKDRVALSLGTHEIDLIARAKTIAGSLGYKASSRVGCQHGTSTDVRFGGPVIAAAFKSWCGDGSKNKKVPEFILMNADQNIVRAYLDGLTAGDGWEQARNKQDNPTIGHGTHSRLLASHVRLCLARIDIGFHGSDKPQKDRYIGDRFIPGGSEFYRTDWTWKPAVSMRKLNGKLIESYSHSWKKVAEGIAIPVKSVSCEDFDGEVFNIETGDHTYIVDGALVHNCDLAINSIIGANRLPKICLIPGVHPLEKQKDGTMAPAQNKYAEFIATAKPLQASDYYYDELKKIRDNEGDNDESLQIIFDAMGTMDSHDNWNDLDPEVAEELRDKMKDLIGRAANRADKSNQWGSVPQHIQEMIRKMLSHEVDWKSIIRNFIGRARSVDRSTTIRRINKKMPYIFPGCRRPMIANFACFMDQSGSMSDEDIGLLFAELGCLANLTKLDVYHFDTEIDEKSHTVWKKGDNTPKQLRTRCGGTDFQSIANFLNEPRNKGKWSGCIVLSDGYAPTMGATPSTKILWVVTPTGTTEHVRPGDLVCKMSVDGGKFKGI